jgi:hypothetical protein
LVFSIIFLYCNEAFQDFVLLKIISLVFMEEIKLAGDHWSLKSCLAILDMTIINVIILENEGQQ